MLERGADVNAPDKHGLTPLLHLAKTRATLDQVAVLELLAAYGADLDARNEAGETLLFFFARQNDPNGVRWLLEHGADPELPPELREPKIDDPESITRGNGGETRRTKALS